MPTEKKEKLPQLDGRLAAAAAFVRPDAVLADVGTDHAYLPIQLLSEGKIRSAAASDIAEGPLSRARAHIAASGMEEKIAAVLCDGLSGLEDYHPTDITICGMGGELIASILAAAPWVRNPDIRLILQPMTMQPFLRKWLYENGFRIETEALAKANGRIYPVLCCSFCGETAEISESDAFFGGRLLAHPDSSPLFAEYIETRRAQLLAIREGKRTAGLPTGAEDSLLSAVSRV